ncbi:flagellar type III secretion system pore protein FliP [Desulfovirgula thermocuniculi]|uniref:flagellar type III secretion system pore protein FliP n=1 Tax=Desulfovirgula thermocuniculi TaxID=348842 RepID=UPI000419A74B|nr:flagellar type III secretion system pore protein FliP [Desulfovirgula thermocuniculi]
MKAKESARSSRRPAKKIACAAIVAAAMVLLAPGGALWAQPLPGIELRLNPGAGPAQVVDTVKLLVLLTLLALAPALLVMVTSFTRLVVVLSILRGALGVQQAPPNQVIIGLALFLTAFIMTPTFQEINRQALQPYLNNQLTQEQFLEAAAKPLKEFMLRQTREKDLALFVGLAKLPQPRNAGDLPLTVVIPAFVISELKTAFEMGFLLYVPFLVIDMVVASALMSMGMFMLPPVMISLPFKLLLFVMVDGWYLVVKSLVESFR